MYPHSWPISPLLATTYIPLSSQPLPHDAVSRLDTLLMSAHAQDHVPVSVYDIAVARCAVDVNAPRSALDSVVAICSVSRVRFRRCLVGEVEEEDGLSSGGEGSVFWIME